ncbi:MAG: hypothetical protein EOM68_13415 [Spirochaetia bacterium]|nr:hypothetical protein [Spirochaetia bacterium]
MKRPLVVMFSFFVLLSSLSAMEVRLLSSFPNQMEISWDAVKGAVWYDLYLDNQPMKRVKAPTLRQSLGSNEESLESNREYQVIVAARTDKNVTLAAAQIPVRTTSWAGHYFWVNLTSDDNGGKCRSLHLEARDVAGELELFGHFSALTDKAVKLFPLVPIAEEYPQFEYQGDGDVELAYRSNASVFNTTSFEPKSWKIVELERKNSSLRTKISTKVGIFSFKTESLLVFEVSEAGEKRVLFHNTGDGLASSGIFKSPNPGENGVFVFVEKGSLADIPTK